MIQTQIQHWPDFDRVLIVDLSSNGMELAGTIQIELWKDPQPFGGTAFAYALWVTEKYRRYLVGTRLLQAAERIARAHGHETISLNWVDGESPKWVYDWYIRKGYIERTFAPNNKWSLLYKPLTKKQ